jgi:cyclopropane fatty-acyl-phospholipid synthase-like methyltransferase
MDMSTDTAWEEWGNRDPYFGVLTHSNFRRCAMTEDDKHIFFESGRLHVQYVMQNIHKHLDPNFTATSVLDFGCGVGRTLIAFAQLAQEAVGLDVSTSMLQEATNNCMERGLSNVSVLRSDDNLSALTRPFDLIHSSIVFQHIPAARGKLIFRNLLNRLTPRGIGAIQFLYAKSQYHDNYGIAPVASSRRFSLRRAKPPQPTGDDPEIQMNPYNLNEILYLVQAAGAQRLYADFSDHGGELGLMIFFQMP